MGIITKGNQTSRDGKPLGKGYSSHSEAVAAATETSEKAAKDTKQVSVPDLKRKSDQVRKDSTE